MLDRKFIVAAGLVLGALSTGAFAQTQPAPEPESVPKLVATEPAKPPVADDGGTPVWIKDETPAQRKARLGTAEDPGPDPDAKKQFYRFGKLYHIERYDRKWAVFDQAYGFVRPFAFANVSFELYAQNAKYVWVWVEDKEPADTANAAQMPDPKQQLPVGTPRRYTDYAMNFFRRVRPEFTAITPPASGRTIRFEDSSSGLPIDGSWRNSLAVADMNGDGFMDLIAPPPRGASTGAPYIFLGDGKGHWKSWKAAKWPHRLDYGSVAAADFNKDGHMDLVFGVHLTGVYLFLGDGKGKFTEVTDGLARDFATRRVRVADVDNDGWPDVVAITEGPSVREEKSPEYGPVRAFLNRKKGTAFEGVNIVQPGVKTGGDWLTAGNFNGDKYPDFLVASIYYGSWDIVYLSQGLKKWANWDKNDGNVLPSLSYYLGSTAGKFSSKTKDDAIVSYVRFWPDDLDPADVEKPAATQVTSIDRLSFEKNGDVKRTAIVRWTEGEETRGVASGDFDGDGNLDIVYTHLNPREVVILFGDGKGGFTRATVEGIDLPAQVNYDITVADVNHDGRPDLAISFEAAETKKAFAKKDGSIRVWLNRGIVKPEATAK